MIFEVVFSDIFSEEFSILNVILIVVSNSTHFRKTWHIIENHIFWFIVFSLNSIDDTLNKNYFYSYCIEMHIHYIDFFEFVDSEQQIILEALIWYKELQYFPYSCLTSPYINPIANPILWTTNAIIQAIAHWTITVPTAAFTPPISRFTVATTATHGV